MYYIILTILKPDRQAVIMIESCNTLLGIKHFCCMDKADYNQSVF